MSRLLIMLMVFVGLTSCVSSQSADKQSSPTSLRKDRVEVLYFHGKQRCMTCNAIERLTKEVVDADFAEQLREGKVIFRVVDISTAEGEKIADQYEVSWSALYINKWADGAETRNNMTNFGFTYAKASPEQFKEGVRNRIAELAADTSDQAQ